MPVRASAKLQSRAPGSVRAWRRPSTAGGPRRCSDRMWPSAAPGKPPAIRQLPIRERRLVAEVCKRSALQSASSKLDYLRARIGC